MSGGRLSYSRIGGDPVLDLLNTVEWRLDPQRSVDDLPDYRSALRWAQQCEIISDAEAAELQRQVAAAPSQHVAEQHAQLLLCAKRSTPVWSTVRRKRQPADRRIRRQPQPRPASVERGDLGLVRALTRAEHPPRPGIQRTVALITSPAIAQLNQCEDSACGWVFLDTSRGRNRRWCSATDCGNRNRARRYYARHRDEPHSDV